MQSGMARYVIGGVLVILGLLLLLSTTGLLPLNLGWGFIGDWWPLLLVGWGLYGLVSGGRLRFRSWAVILLLLGILFQLAELGFWEWSNLARLWPGLIVLAGLLILLRRRGRSRSRRRAARQLDNAPAEPLAAGEGRELPNPPAESLAAEEERDFLSGSWAFSSGASRAVSQNFQGGDLSVTFGGLELDLREAALAAGGATLALEVVFASVKIQVPGNWQVTVTSNTHIGGVTENRPQPAPEDTAGQLTITGKLVFGGLEISG